MLDHHPPWAAQAWQHWHRPWAVTHASWMREPGAIGEAGGANELALRLHYPAWCRHHGLEPTLSDFADTAWWRLFGLPMRSFDQVVLRVGLTLMFAADRRLRLLRGGVVDVALIRWALERAHFLPEPVAHAVHKHAADATAEAHAALSLRWCLDAMPALWARMRLRFAHEHVLDDDGPLRSDPFGAAERAHLARLWRNAARGNDEASP